jgi:hypothetical protein
MTARFIQEDPATIYKVSFPLDTLGRFITAAIYREEEISADEFIN